MRAVPGADSPAAVSLRVLPSANVSRGASFSVECRAEGLPPPTYGWALPLAPNLRFAADNRSVAVAGAATANRGLYTCTATNRHGRRAGSVVVRVDGETWRGPWAKAVLGGLSGTAAASPALSGPRREPVGAGGLVGFLGGRDGGGFGGRRRLLPEDDGV